MNDFATLSRSHLDAMFLPQRGAVPVVCGAVSFYGLERKGSDSPFGDSQTDSWTVTVPTYRFDAVAIVGAAVTVNGIAAKIIRVIPQDDGASLNLDLSEA